MEDCEMKTRRYRDRVYQKAIDLWGTDAQIDMIEEECIELLLAIKRFKRGRGGIENIMEEVADVSIMGEQAEVIFDYSIKDFKNAKFNRLEKRIESAERDKTLLRFEDI